MALVLAFRTRINDNCESITFTETTGSVTNGFTEGYGAGNELIGDVTLSELVVKNESAGVTYDDITIVASDTELETNINASALLLNTVAAGLTSFADGIWSFTYNVTADGNNYSTQKVFLVSCGVVCRIQTYLAKILDSNQCCITDKQKEQAKELLLSYDLITWATPLGYLSDVKEALTILQNTLTALEC